MHKLIIDGYAYQLLDGTIPTSLYFDIDEDMDIIKALKDIQDKFPKANIYVLGND